MISTCLKPGRWLYLLRTATFAGRHWIPSRLQGRLDARSQTLLVLPKTDIDGMVLERFAKVEENRLEDALALARSSLWPFTNEVAKASKCCHGAKVWEVWKSCFFFFHCEGFSLQ